MDHRTLTPVQQKGVYMGVRASHRSPIHTEYFEDASSWTPAGCTADEETTLVRDYYTNKKSVLLTATGGTGCSASKTLGSAVDLRNTHVNVSFYVDPAYTADNLTRVALAFYGGSGAYTEFKNLWQATARLKSDGGWHSLRFNIAPTTYAADEYTKLANVSRIRLRMDYPSEQTPAVVFDSLELVPEQGDCHYIITFDDGNVWDYTAARYLADRGVKGTFFICPSRVNNAGRTTLTQLQEMKAMGHLIANHSWSHLYLVTDSLSPGEAAEEIRKGAEWLEDNGFENGAQIYAVPGGSASLRDWPEHPGKLMQCCDLMRLTTPPANIAEYAHMWGTGNVLYTCCFDDNTLADGFLSSRYTDNGALICTGYHASLTDNSVVDGEGVLLDAFKTHINNVAAAQAAGSLRNYTAEKLCYGVLEY